MIGHMNWVEDKEVQSAIKVAKGKVQEALKPGKVIGGSRDENVGVAFEYPDAKVSYQYYHNPQNNPLICQGYGGTTTTGETARKIFQSSVLRERLVDLCPPIYQQAMSQILLNDLTLLTLMSCDKLLNVSKIGELDLSILSCV